jgi:hypothetical protein
MDSEVEEESRKGKGAVFLQGEAIDNTNDQWKYRGARRIRLGLDGICMVDGSATRSFDWFFKGEEPS